MTPHVSTAFLLLAFLPALAPVMGAPTHLISRQQSNGTTTATPLQQQNGLAAQKLNTQFANLTATDSCDAGAMACVNQQFAQCVGGKWALTPCSSGMICVALPLVNKAGTAISCDTQKDALARFEAAGVQGGLTGTGEDDGGECDDDNGTADDDNNGGQEECDDDSTTVTSAASTSARTSPTANASGILTSLGVTTTPSPSPTANSNQILTSFGTTTPTPSPSAPSNNYKREKRQFTNITSFLTTPGSSTALPSSSTSPSSSPLTVTVVPSPSTIPIGSSSVPTVTVTATGTSFPVITSTPSSTSGEAEPTSIVIGSDGFRTVTVVSTVIVGCGASTAFPSAATSTIGSAPLSSSVPTASLPAAPATATIASSGSGSSIPTSSGAPTFVPVFSSFSASSSSASSNPTGATATQQGGILFTPAPAPTPTPSPNNGAAGASINLTATIGSSY